MDIWEADNSKYCSISLSVKNSYEIYMLVLQS